jgi:hypothetical protein
MISEPVTLVTDWLLAALCVALGLRLLRHARRTGQRSVCLFAGPFFSTALAAFIGGAAHGFRPYLGSWGNFFSWKLSVLAIGVTTLLFVAAAATAALLRPWRRIVIGVAVLQAAVYFAWMMFHDEFIWVIADYVPAMSLVLALQVLQWRRGEPSAPWLAAGIATSLVGATIQASGYALHEHFNHNDLYHVVQMAATWILYRGGLLLRDR